MAKIETENINGCQDFVRDGVYKGAAYRSLGDDKSILYHV